MKLKRPVKKTPVIDMTPVTDIVLQLLSFFMLTYSVMKTSAINVDLPSSKTSDVQTTRNAVITLYRNGDLSLNSESITIDNLGIKIKGLYIQDNNIVVTIQGDKGVPYGRLIEAMDVVRLTGVRKMSLATVAQEP